MLIGLARHFPVAHARGVVLDADGFARWAEWYDAATGIAHAPGAAAAAVAWRACYCSDLPRARHTAATIHRGEAAHTASLREVPFAPVVRTRLRLPLLLWQALSRVAWALDHASQHEGRRATRRRVASFVDELVAAHADEAVLVVGHGFLMQLLAAELRCRGFRGRVPLRPRGGEVYLFERPAPAAASSAR